MNDSLVLMMNFDNKSALGENDTHVLDISGNGNNGTVTGATVNLSGKYESAFEFVSGDQIDVSKTSSTDVGNIFSILAWVYVDDVSSTRQGVYSTRRTNDAGSWQLEVGTMSTGSGKFGLVGVGTFIAESSDSVLSAKTWHQIVAVKNGTASTDTVLYLDGSEVSYTQRNSFTAADSVDDPVIGEGTSGAQNYDGKIDDIMLFNRSLNATEIQQLYFTNLQKYNTTQWYLYVNQSLNSTTGLPDDTYTYFASAKDSIGNVNLTSTQTVTIDLLPIVTINFPTNITYSSADLPLMFNISLNENGTAWYSLDGGTNNYTMEGDESTNFGTMFNHSNGSIADGGYVFSAYANDTDGNTNYTVNVTFSLNVCPGANSNWAIEADYSLTVSVNCNIINVTNGSTLTINASGIVLNATSIYIENGSTLTHTNNSDSMVYTLNVSAVNLSIDSTSFINVSGKGFIGGTSAGASGTGPGGGGSDSANAGGGGGYGGQGGCGDVCADANGGEDYGSITAPTDIGSGGGGGDAGTNGGAGAGAIFLNITDKIIIEGNIIAIGEKGTDGTSASAVDAAGGGSGGSVYIIAGVFNGSGSIDSSGGDGGVDVGSSIDAGGGGGGRIALYYTTNEFIGNVTAYGGFGTGSALDGGAGTIYEKLDSETYGNLIIDNNDMDLWYDNSNDGFGMGRTPINATYNFNNLTIKNFGNLIIEDNANVTYVNLNWTDNGVITDNGGSNGNFTLFISGSDLAVPLNARLVANTYRNYSTVEINGTLTHSGPQTTYRYSINISAVNFTLNGVINTSAKGFIGGTTDGVSGTGDGGGGSDSLNAGGGGGYGGQGGCGDVCADANGGEDYGSITAPTDIGSGGGGGDGGTNGGVGGGAIFLNITDKIIVNGTIDASGEKGTDGTSASAVDAAGGGSGGSVYIIAGVFNGTGNINSSGGAGGVDVGSSVEGGGGGGGRIALYYNTSSFTGNVLVSGGSVTGSAVAGNLGTFFRCADPLMSCSGISPQSVFVSDGSSVLITEYNITQSIEINKTNSLINATYINWTDSSSNGSLIATYNISGLQVSQTYYLYDNQLDHADSPVTSDSTGNLTFNVTLSSPHLHQHIHLRNLPVLHILLHLQH